MSSISTPGDRAAVEVRELLSAHESWRRQTLNLIASENVLSPAVRSLIENDLLCRYASYNGRDLRARKYSGGRYIAEIELLVEQLVRKLYRTRHVELRAVSGHLAGTAVLAALCRPGDRLLELGADAGGHRQADRVCLPTLMPLDVRPLPFNGLAYNIDVPAAAKLIKAFRPRMVILGSSSFLFPHPVAEIKDALQKCDPASILVYDASHVMGFLAAGKFQDPLKEGADVVFGSTHKTLPGPQGGIIYTNREELIGPISKAVYPALVTNHHPFRMPALAMTLAETESFGEAYAEQMSGNAQALGTTLERAGIPCVTVGGRYSRSHTLLLKVAELGKAQDLVLRLEKADILTGKTTLPKLHGSEGIRIGVQEITRLGAMEEDMAVVGTLLARVLKSAASPSDVARDVHALSTSLGPVRYTWEKPVGGAAA
jgi:glycine hydroxymethyltransferase